VGGRHRELEREVHGEVEREDDVYGKQRDGDVQDRSDDSFVREYFMEKPGVGRYGVGGDDPGQGMKLVRNSFRL